MFVVSPTAILYDTAGNPIAVSPNVAIPAGTSTILVAGTDGSVARVLSVDATGRLNVAANLNSGTNYVGRTRQTDGTLDLTLLNSAPASDTGQVSVPVRVISSLAGGGGSGGTSSNYTQTFPATGTAAGFTDGTNMQGARVFDADTGAGTQYVLGANLRVSASGGSTEAAAGAGTTTAATLRVVLPTDQTAIPVTDNGGSITVDGTVTANQGTAAALAGRWPVQVTDGTNTLPTGDAAARSIFTKVSDGTNGPVAVKPASTQAVVTDPSLVVQITPNQPPIPTTVVPATSIAGSAIGRASGLSANTFTTVRQTTYVEQTTNAQRSIVSTSASDSAAGTGARQVRITYLDATCAGPFTETVTLNGTTAVNTVATNICFIERMDVISTGSNGSNVGTLNLYTGTGATGTIFAAIGTGAIATGRGDNQTLYAHHYVPVNYEVTGYYVSVGIVASAGGGASVTVIQFRNPTVATSPWLLASDFINSAQGNSTARTYYASIKIPGPLVVAAWVTPANNNSTATCSFDYADAPI